MTTGDAERVEVLAHALGRVDQDVKMALREHKRERCAGAQASQATVNRCWVCVHLTSAQATVAEVWPATAERP